MKCKACQEEYDDLLSDDFVNGECLPCITGREIEKDRAKEDKELIRFNAKFKTDYDEESFYYACRSGEVSIDLLRGYPMLKSSCRHALKIEAEINSLKPKTIQLSLFDALEHLPF